MKTTKTVSSPKRCGKCSGQGRLSAFQHIKGGECFQCGGTGFNGVTSKEVELTDEEVVFKLGTLGFIIDLPDPLALPEDESWLLFLFNNPCPRKETLQSARKLLSEI